MNSTADPTEVYEMYQRWRMLPRWLRRLTDVVQHYGERETARRRRQMQAGILNEANKGVVNVK